MAFFPKIQSPCPYKSQLASVMDGDMCRMCKRQVIDIGAWSDDERVAFLAGCETEVCVSYTLPLRPALAAAALAAAALPSAVAAQTVTPVAAAEAPEDSGIELTVMVGGIKDPRNVEFVAAEDIANLPDVPVVYEDEAPPPAKSGA
jgi:predicted Fe-S protein YdhL (DUF1289 family)